MDRYTYMFLIRDRIPFSMIPVIHNTFGCFTGYVLYLAIIKTWSFFLSWYK